jgi:ferredoxin-NADP reductase
VPVTFTSPPSAAGSTAGDPAPAGPYRLRVAAAAREADAVISLTLRHPGGRDLPAWEPGAHIDLHLPSGRIRQYSLCGSPGRRGEYRIAVLREQAGRGGSAEIHALPLGIGYLEASGPRNHFPLRDSPRYLFIAGGIGITPVLPMIAAVAGSRPWALHYGGRSRASMAFAGEVIRLGGGRARLVPQDEDGPLDVEAIVATAGPGTAVYCCGPQGLLRAVEDACRRLAPGAPLYTERFTPGPAADPAPAAGEERPFRVELRRTGATLDVPADRSLLDAVRDVLPDVPFSCEEGYCGSCETTVLGGEPDHRDDILSPGERAEGKTMMICVGRALSDTLILDL